MNGFSRRGRYSATWRHSWRHHCWRFSAAGCIRHKLSAASNAVQRPRLFSPDARNASVLAKCHMMHWCNKRFYVFLFGSRFYVFNVFNVFRVFYLEKRCQKQSMNMQKSTEKHSYRMPQQWFLLILVCYVTRTAIYLTYLLKSADVTQIIVELMANLAKFFIKRSQTFFIYFHVFIWTFITSMIWWRWSLLKSG